MSGPVADYLWIFWGVSIIPTWLILTPGHIAIVFGTFLELPTNRLSMDARTSYLLPKYFKKHKKYGNLVETYYFHIRESKILKNVEGLRTYFSELAISVFVFGILKF